MSEEIAATARRRAQRCAARQSPLLRPLEEAAQRSSDTGGFSVKQTRAAVKAAFIMCKNTLGLHTTIICRTAARHVSTAAHKAAAGRRCWAAPTRTDTVSYKMIVL